MITCSICGVQNDELAVLCSSCKSYLQSKVDSLNLFATIWQLIENPRAAFKKIVLARHKNYVFEAWTKRLPSRRSSTVRATT